MMRVGEGLLGGMEPFELAAFKDGDVSPSFFSSSQLRQMQTSVLRLPRLPGRCERQVLSGMFGKGGVSFRLDDDKA